MLEINKIYNQDCLEGMKLINDKSIDMILCDTQLPFDQLWKQYERIIKDNGIIILFANGMFTADLMTSNKKLWKYNLVWNKVLPSGFLNAKKMPMRSHEDICIFYKKPPKYNPQMVEGNECHSRGNVIGKKQEDFSRNTNYGELKAVQTEGNLKYPKSILTFQKPHPSTTIHPTQKPVECLEWLIKTYTNENELILDNCVGSGSTIVAAINTNRNYIGFELEENYYKAALERINKI